MPHTFAEIELILFCVLPFSTAGKAGPLLYHQTGDLRLWLSKRNSCGNITRARTVFGHQCLGVLYDSPIVGTATTHTYVHSWYFARTPWITPRQKLCSSLWSGYLVNRCLNSRIYSLVSWLESWELKNRMKKYPVAASELSPISN